MRFPGIIAVQRLRTWLLVTALVSVVLTAVLVADLARNLRTVVISEANKALTSAVRELSQSAATPPDGGKEGPDRDRLDQRLREVSYEILRSYPDVEGGYLWDRDVVGHSFPTYTEPGSTLRQPAVERREVLAAVEESRRTGRAANRIVQDGRDLVLVSAWSGPAMLSSWCLRRIFNFSDSSELDKRFLLVAALGVSLVAIGAVLRLSFSLQHGFEVIQAGLERLRTEVGYRLPDANRELRTIVLAINEMAEARQNLEADLRREDRLRVMGRVVAGVAHEIRNPLNSIRLTVRVLARRLQGSRQSEETIALVTSEIDRLDALLKSLLVFRADQPQKLRRQPIEPLLDRTLTLVKPHAEENGVNVRIRAESECEARVDGDHLQQALMNLLLNAIDASKQDGVVDVSVRRFNKSVEIDVQDSGPGLTPDQQERIFEAFYTTKSGGTGLGLAVTKTLVEKMGGTIQSESGSGGARFRVLLPVE